MIKIGFENKENTASIINIYDAKGNIKAKYALDKKDQEVYKIMKEHHLSISFNLNVFHSFDRGDYILWKSTKYILREGYIPEQKNKNSYTYNLQFDAPEILFQDIQAYYLNQDLKESTWSLTADVRNFTEIFVQNINRYYGTTDYKVGTIESTEVKYLSIDNANTFDAITTVAEEFELEWYLDEYKALHFVKKFTFGSEVDLEVGESVLSMDRSEGEGTTNYTRIVALGSTKNIPYNYRGTTNNEGVDAIYQKRLRIPISKGSVIDTKPNLTPSEVVEGTVIFDDIYPKRVGEIEAVEFSKETITDKETKETKDEYIYKIKDSGIKFKEEYLLAGVELRLFFQSGPLNGMDFALAFHDKGFSKTDNSQYFEIIRNEEYGIQLPNGTLKPKKGDKYVLYGFNISMVGDQYVPLAEQELYEKALQWLKNQAKDNGVYSCETIAKYFSEKNLDLEVGQKVKLIHPQFEGGFRLSRIQGYKKSLTSNYNATYEVGEQASYSRLGSIEKEIKELRIEGKTYTNENSGSGSVYLIKQNDATYPTDFNTYSAKAINDKFLNKKTGGFINGDLSIDGKTTTKELQVDQNTQVKGSLTVAKNLQVDEGAKIKGSGIVEKDLQIGGKAITNLIQNSTFTAGALGSGFQIKMLNGDSHAIFNYLTVTKEMIINELTINKIKSVGGSIILSLASMKLIKVEDKGTYWRCYFDNDEGNITNDFVKGDQAICQTFSGKNIKRYWSLVLNTGADYIDLSKTDKDGTSIPEVGDEVLQLGHRTNYMRQNAIVLTTYGTDAPAIYQYAKINSFSFVDKAVTIISPNGNKFIGEFEISVGGVNTPISDAWNSDVRNAISNLQSGGLNLIDNSDFSNGVTGFIPYNADTQISIDTNKRMKVSGTAWRVHYPIGALAKGEYIVQVESWYQLDEIAWRGTNSKYLRLEQYKTEAVGDVEQGTRIFAKLTLPNDDTGYIQFNNTKDFRFAHPQLEKGNIPTPWGLSQSDKNKELAKIQEGVNTANTNALNAQSEANTAKTNASNAQASANNANSLLSDIANDNKLDPSEKQSIKKEWEIIVGEYPKNTAQATKFSVGVVAYTNAYKALNDYITPLLKNINVTSDINGNIFRNTFKTYYDSRTDLLNAIAEKTKQIANEAYNEVLIVRTETEAKFQVLKDQIAMKVSSSDFDALGVKVGENSSALTILDNRITSEVGSVKQIVNNTVSNLQSGGLNLIDNSDFSNGVTGFIPYNADTQISIDTNKRMKVTGTAWRVHYPIGALVKGEYIVQVESWYQLDEIAWRGTNSKYLRLEQYKTESVGDVEQGTRIFAKLTLPNDDTGYIQFNNTKDFRFAHPQLEKGNIPTPWGLSQSDRDKQLAKIQESVNTANTNANEAQNTANDTKTEIISVKQELGSRIDQTDQNIKLEVSRVETTVTQVSTKADSAQSTANTANTNAVKAQSTANDTKAQLEVTKTELTSIIDQTESKIRLEVKENINTSLSNLQSGGLNLIDNSDFSNGVTGFIPYNADTQISIDTNKRMKVTGTAWRVHYSIGALTKGEYIVQVESWYQLDEIAWRGTNSKYLRLEQYKTEAVGDVEQGTRIFAKLTLPNDDTGYIQFNNTKEFRFAHPQLEKGNIPTPWGLSQSDRDKQLAKIQEGVNTANTNANEAKTQIISTKQEFDSKLELTKNNFSVQVSEVNTEVAKVSTKADTAQSTANSASSSASKAQSTADTANANAGKAQSTANDAKAQLEVTKTELTSTIEQNKNSITIEVKEVRSKADNAQATADGKTTLSEVKAGLKVTATGVTAFGNEFKVDNKLLASVIETEELTVGDKFHVGKDGTVTAKNCNLSGVLAVPFVSKELTNPIEATILDLKENFNLSFWCAAPTVIYLPSDIKYNGVVCNLHNSGIARSHYQFIIKSKSGSIFTQGMLNMLSSVEVGLMQLGTFIAIGSNSKNAKGEYYVNWYCTNYDQLI